MSRTSKGNNFRYFCLFLTEKFVGLRLLFCTRLKSGFSCIFLQDGRTLEKSHDNVIFCECLCTEDLSDSVHVRVSFPSCLISRDGDDRRGVSRRPEPVWRRGGVFFSDSFAATDQNFFKGDESWERCFLGRFSSPGGPAKAAQVAVFPCKSS